MFAKLYGLPTISPEEVEQQLGQSQVVIIDNNPPHVWAQGHVPGAINLDPAAYTETELPADKRAMLIFYCSGPMCGAAPHAAKRAVRLGYQQVYVMSAGISGWLKKNRPVEARSATSA